jgi:hypothetical protein
MRSQKMAKTGIKLAVLLALTAPHSHAGVQSICTDKDSCAKLPVLKKCKTLDDCREAYINMSTEDGLTPEKADKRDRVKELGKICGQGSNLLKCKDQLAQLICDNGGCAAVGEDDKSSPH